MAKRTRGKDSNKSININLEGVETSRKTVPEGRYTVTLDETTMEESDKGKYIKFIFEVSEGSCKGSKLFHNASLQPQALFNLKSVLLALGFTIPSKAFDLDLNDLTGLQCEVEVMHEVYEGKKKARITEFVTNEESDEEDDAPPLYSKMTLDELREECDENEIEYKKAIKGKSKKESKEILIDLLLDSDDDSSDDDSDDEDYEDMEIDELKDECKDRGIKFSKKAKKSELIELLEEDDEE